MGTMEMEAAEDMVATGTAAEMVAMELEEAMELTEEAMEVAAVMTLVVMELEVETEVVEAANLCTEQREARTEAFTRKRQTPSVVNVLVNDSSLALRPLFW